MKQLHREVILLAFFVFSTWLLIPVGGSTPTESKPRHCKHEPTPARHPGQKRSKPPERIGSGTKGEPERTFHLFASLPPELRNEIWRAALPTPGVNIFRLAPVFMVNPAKLVTMCKLCWDFPLDNDYSVWQTRRTLMETCREARANATPPPGKGVKVRLERPTRLLKTKSCQLAPRVTPWVTRNILVHVDEMLILQIQQGLDEMNHIGLIYNQQWRPRLPPLPHLSDGVDVPWAKVSVEYDCLGNTRHCAVWSLVKDLRCRPHPQALFHTITSHHPSTRGLPKRILRLGEGRLFHRLATYYGACGEEFVLFDVETVRELAMMPASRVLTTPWDPCDLTAPPPPTEEGELHDPRELWSSVVQRVEDGEAHGMENPRVSDAELEVWRVKRRRSFILES